MRQGNYIPISKIFLFHILALFILFLNISFAQNESQQKKDTTLGKKVEINVIMDKRFNVWKKNF